MVGTRLIKAFLIILAIILIKPDGKTQETGFSVMAYPSAGYNLIWEPGMNGGGISVFFNRQKYSKLNLSLSGEYAMTTWGHQAFFGIGINRTWLSLNRFELNTFGHMLNGMAFFKPGPIYVFGIDARAAANFYLYQNTKLFIGTGPRYTLAPGYRKYGLIETSFDLPLEIGLKFTPGR